MNKRLLVALMPFLIQTNLYCDDINQMIMPELEYAQFIMRNNTKPELQPTLDALVLFGKKSDYQARQSVKCMESIKSKLAYYREKEHKAWSQGSKTWWDWFWGNNPKKVEEEIDPAIAQVDAALKKLGANSSTLGYAVAASIAATVLAGGIFYAATNSQEPQYYEYPDSNDSNAPEEYCDPNKISAAYKILGLDSKTATKTEAKKAYRKLALTLHPDKGGDPEEFKKIASANEFIQECSA